jgi:hypothetical protein
MSRRSLLPGGRGNGGPAGSPAGSASSASPADSPDSPESPLLSSGSGGHDIGYFSPPPLLDIGTTQEVEHAIFQGVVELEAEKNAPIDNSDDVNHILKELKKNQGIIDAFRRVSVSDDEQDKIILSYLDELNCFRQGCARVQLLPLSQEYSDLRDILHPPTPMDEVPVTKLETMKKKARDALKSAKNWVSSDHQAQVNRYEKLKTQLGSLETTHLKLMKNSFFARYRSYKHTVSTAIESLIARHPNVESFCGEARFLDGAAIRLVGFQLNIRRRSNGTRELILGCQPDGTNDMMTAADEEGIMNALLSYLLGNQSDHEYKAIKIGKLEPIEPMNKKACGCCNVQGGAKKIKRTRQSKKKRMRRSKSKSKRVRRKNKSRRN